MDWSKTVTLAGYGDVWRNYRRIMNNWLNRRDVVQFGVLQERQARLLLQRLLNITSHPQPFRLVRDELFL
jgi:hypothetical protein